MSDASVGAGPGRLASGSARSGRQISRGQVPLVCEQCEKLGGACLCEPVPPAPPVDDDKPPRQPRSIGEILSNLAEDMDDAADRLGKRLYSKVAAELRIVAARHHRRSAREAAKKARWRAKTGGTT